MFCTMQFRAVGLSFTTPSDTVLYGKVTCNLFLNKNMSVTILSSIFFLYKSGLTRVFLHVYFSDLYSILIAGALYNKTNPCIKYIITQLVLEGYNSRKSENTACRKPIQDRRLLMLLYQQLMSKLVTAQSCNLFANTNRLNHYLRSFGTT